MNVRLRHDMHFTAGVFYGGQMRMNHYNLRLWMTTNSTDPASHNTAFERIKYFVYQELDSTIFISSEHEEQCRQYMNSGLSITTLPGEPVDQLIGIMLYYKLNAIMQERMIIEETEISSALGENMTYLHCNNENTDLVSWPDWWTSADPLHCDSVLIDTKVVNMPHASAWKDLDLLWPDAGSETETGNIVVFADFKKNDGSE